MAMTYLRTKSLQTSSGLASSLFPCVKAVTLEVLETPLSRESMHNVFHIVHGTSRAYCQKKGLPCVSTKQAERA